MKMKLKLISKISACLLVCQLEIASEMDVLQNYANIAAAKFEDSLKT